MSDTEHIRGDTFTVTGIAGAGNYSGWIGKSQVRSAATDDLLSELEFTWVDALTGKFVVQTKDTNHWPAGEVVNFDVQITSPNGVVVSSGLVKITVLKDVTRDG